MRSTQIEVCCRNNHDDILIGEQRNLVSSIPLHKVGAKLFVARLERTQPPKVSVVGIVVDLRMWSHGIRNPLSGNDPLTIPGAAIRVQLPQLEQITTPQSKSATRHRQSRGDKLPLDSVDAERAKQILCGKLRNWDLCRPLQHAAERNGAGGAITETAAIG